MEASNEEDRKAYQKEECGIKEEGCPRETRTALRKASASRVQNAMMGSLIRQAISAAEQHSSVAQWQSIRLLTGGL